MSDESSFRRILRAVGWQLLAGLIVGVFFWELFGQGLITVKYGSLGSSVTCAPDVKKALSDFDSGLRLSALIGAVSCSVLVFVGKRWWRKRKLAAANPPAPTGNPPGPPT
jgi:hypothetical protein